jgi:hypothetical protein
MKGVVIGNKTPFVFIGISVADYIDVINVQAIAVSKMYCRIF